MRAPAAQLRRCAGAATRRVAGCAARGDASAAPASCRTAGSMPVIMAACLVVAAITLLTPSTPTYDPWAWIMWGREIAHLDLVTEGGPSWKPLPDLFTVPFSVFGETWRPTCGCWSPAPAGCSRA